MKGQRVIFVLGNLELGGAERQALIFARHLAQQEQASVEVWGFNKAGPVAEICEQHGIHWRVEPLHANRLESIRRVAGLLRSARPDVLLPYTWWPNVVCGLVWKSTGARLCVWNQRDEGLFLPKRAWERWAVQRTPRFISNSHAGARFLIEKLKVDPAKVRVVHNGIEPSTPQLNRNTWRKRLEIDDATFVACMVANLHTNKDHETLLQAWRIVMTSLDQRGRSAVLVLAGRHDGAYESLVTLTRELELERGVRFAGPVDDIAGLLTAVDVGVFSSRSEGCPNGVLECMAAGLPVAGTDIEGVREVLGSSELLAPVGDASALADTILRLAADPAMCSMLGAQNRKRIVENYDAGRMCEELVKTIEGA
ncbi:MAG TPA: glycosyltransferase family 4 protein [Pyrinomonadaceae bacterium]|nr:glycosyltransferase family 4 protein [Pyrinomonadaceae bacterium]